LPEALRRAVGEDGERPVDTLLDFMLDSYAARPQEVTR
jgi:hypothetical protein